MFSEKANRVDMTLVIIHSVRRKGSEAQVPLLPKSSSRRRRSACEFLRDVKGHSIIRHFRGMFANSEALHSKSPSDWWYDYHQWERRQSRFPGRLSKPSLNKSSDGTGHVTLDSPLGSETSATKQD